MEGNFEISDIPACADNEYREVAWGINRCGEKFTPMWINRPKVGDYDVRFEMKFCGICHSDVHIGQNDLGGCIYPIVPGHELVGTVVEVGSKVQRCKVGDNVGVGCIIDSCMKCSFCDESEEQYCLGGGNTHTYNSRKTYGHIGGNPETQNFGGYSGSNTVHERYVMKIPDSLPLEKAGPLMCAAITMYDPLRHWGATKEGSNMNIGIVGIGGLGTMGIKLAKAMGHKIFAISTSPNKKELAEKKGADVFVCSTDNKSMNENANQMDLIINTVAGKHELQHYISLLRTNGTLVQLGLVTENHTVNQLPLVF
jgi:uncharacterized zinc-type alcohol dehydrogenase-like protein